MDLRAQFIKKSGESEAELDETLQAVGYTFEKAFPVIQHLLDPQDPSRTKKGVYYTNRQYLLCTVLAIKSWRNQAVGGGALLHTSANPLAVKTLRQRAPQELTLAKAQADQKHEEAKAITITAFNSWRTAMREMQKFLHQWGAGELSPAGAARRTELQQRIEQADRDFHQAEDVENAARIAAMQAELQIQNWCWIERERIQDEGKAKAKAAKLAAKNGGDQTLAGRLKALKKKVEGKKL